MHPTVHPPARFQRLELHGCRPRIVLQCLPAGGRENEGVDTSDSQTSLSMVLEEGRLSFRTPSGQVQSRMLGSGFKSPDRGLGRVPVGTIEQEINELMISSSSPMKVTHSSHLLSTELSSNRMHRFCYRLYLTLLQARDAAPWL